MATRMQQRRGTAEQWTSADPTLEAGEIGFETDTGKFKIGDGANPWSDLDYFLTITELGGTIDDYVPLTQRAAADGVATLDGTVNVPLNQLGNIIDDSAGAWTTWGSVPTINDIAAAINNNPDYFTSVNYDIGLVNTSIEAQADEIQDHETRLGVVEAASTANTTDIGLLETRAGDLETAVGDLEGDLSTLTTTVGANYTTLDGNLSTHNSDTTNVHGIVDTAALATKTGAETLTNKTISAADNTVTVNLADVIDVTASVAEVNILDGATLSTAELNHVDGVTSNIQTQLDAKAPLADPTFTGTLTAADISITGDLTVGGTTTTVNAQDLVVSDPLIYIGEGNTANIVDLGLVSSFNNGAYQHAGIVRDATDGVWKLFSSVEDEPTTTVNFAQAVYDTLKVGGIEYADGVQVKQGVPSLTEISAQTSAYTTVLTDRDKLVEVSSATGVTITIPTNESVAYPVGTSIDILQTGAGQVTIAGAAGVTVNSTPGLKLRTQWSSATMFKRAENTWVVFGDLSA